MNIRHNKTLVRRQKEKTERRKAILSAAREVFFEKGFMAATVDAIADKCDLAKGTIYLYFKSKEELYISMMAEGMELLRKDLVKVLDLALPGDGLLGEVLQTYFAFYRENRKYFTVIFLSSHPDVRERVPDEVLNECMDSARGCMQVVSDVIGRGIESGVFRRVDPWPVANILWATVNGIILSYEQGPLYREEILKGAAMEDILRAALDVVLEGLRDRET